MAFVTKNKNIRYTLPFYILVFWFTYSNPIFNINGFRFWTASWMAIYLTFNVIINKRNIYALFLPLLLLVHSSFILYNLIFIASYLLKGKDGLWMPAFVISIFFSEVLLQILPMIKDSLPQFMQDSIWAYTESEFADEIISGKRDGALPMYARIMNRMPHYFDLTAVFLLIRERANITNETTKRMLGFLVVYYSLFNMAAAVPSVGRYFWTAIPMIVFVWVDAYPIMKKYNKYIYLMPICYSYSILYWYRNMVSIANPLLYISNWLHLIWHNLL